ncbi:hypothetical protein RCL1_000642 [Eukaryota sp. TZLM3-RCL]
MFSLYESPEDLNSLKTHASEDTKVRACLAYTKLSSNQTELTQYYSVSQSTISRWLKMILTGTTNERNKLRPKALTSYQEQILLQVLKEHPLLFLRE